MTFIHDRPIGSKCEIVSIMQVIEMWPMPWLYECVKGEGVANKAEQSIENYFHYEFFGEIIENLQFELYSVKDYSKLE